MIGVAMFLSIICWAYGGIIEEETFKGIEENQQEQLVVFYRSSQPASKQTLNVVEEVVGKISAQLPHFRFKKCDGDLPVNRDGFANAAFTAASYIFTQTPGEGIVKYTGEVNAEKISRHILMKYLEFDEKDVVQFNNEEQFWDLLDTQPLQSGENAKPVFVKFYEQWCAHCKRLKRGWNIAATYFKNKVIFAEIECSANEETAAFCMLHEAKSFPTLKFFTGEKKILYSEDTRDIVTFENFFQKHTPHVLANATTSSTSQKQQQQAKEKEPAEAGKKEKPAPKTEGLNNRINEVEDSLNNAQQLLDEQHELLLSMLDM